MVRFRADPEGSGLILRFKGFLMGLRMEEEAQAL